VSAVRRHPIITFFVLTYALTFLGGVPNTPRASGPFPSSRPGL
jgi:hypothetical protein